MREQRLGLKKYVDAEISIIKACAFASRILSSSFSRVDEYCLIDYIVIAENMLWSAAIIYTFQYPSVTSPILQALSTFNAAVSMI